MTELGTLREATHIEVEAEVRYWEDATVNGISDEDGALIFGRVEGLWKVKIDLTKGLIEGWPKGAVASIHYKVCDAGEYWLLDSNGQRIAKWRSHYVPDDFLCHGDRGYGDYIIFDVSADGRITGYSRPEINEEQWVRLDDPAAT